MPDFPDLEYWLPQGPPVPRRPAPAYEVRHAGEGDFASLDARLRDWCEERGARAGSGRAWFRHFGGTSWLAEASEDRRPLGIVLGFRSVDRPADAVIHLVGVDPALRRRGIGRDLVERFAKQLDAAGASGVTATCRPDDRVALAFFNALGFTPQEGPGSARIYGVPAFAGWEGGGEDRVLLARPIGG